MELPKSKYCKYLGVWNRHTRFSRRESELSIEYATPGVLSPNTGNFYLAKTSN